MNRRLTISLICLVLLALLPAMGAQKKFTLVIDAGHGGHDAGAVGRQSKEKNLTLKYALAFGEMVERNCPDVRVVYTRKTDKFVELYKRAEIANQQKADLFISFHINALPKGRIARGFQTYTLGTSKRTGRKDGVVENLDVARRENAVILMEKDYQRTYHGFDPNKPETSIMLDFIQDKNMENSLQLAQLMQRHVCKATGRQNMGAQQDNLAVLRLTSMPGCLIELGFISTADEEKYMNTREATQNYTKGVFNAFQAYRRQHGDVAETPKKAPETPQETTDTLVTTETPPAPAETEPTTETTQETPPATEEAADADAPIFKVQILTSSAKIAPGDKRLKGLTEVDCYMDGALYKYTVGASTDYQEIRRKRRSLAEQFPEAFIIAFRNGQRIDINEARQMYMNNQKRQTK